jgi:hypothetical protein
VQPVNFLKDTFKDDPEHHLRFAHGTTTLAFIYQGGVVVAVDSRSTMGPYIGTLPPEGETIISVLNVYPKRRNIVVSLRLIHDEVRTLF